MYTNPKISASLVLLSLVSNFVFLQPVQAGTDLIQDLPAELAPVDGLVVSQGHALVQTAVPDMPVVVSRKRVITTAYSSTVDQTDSTPFITALGTDVRDGVVACNFLRFGTKVRFPELYGDKIFVVEDRMALKNSHKIDIWFPERQMAKEFGVQWLETEVLQN